MYGTMAIPGGNVYETAKHVWSFFFTDRLSRKIAWSSIGEPDDDGMAFVGNSNKARLMARKIYNDLGNCLTRKYINKIQ